MRKQGFTLIELIVSIVLVGIVLASMIGTLLSLKNTYNVVNEDMEARTYSTLVSKVINEHIMKNNGIKDYDCAGNKCVITLGTLDKNGNNKKMTLEIVTATLKSNVMKDNKNNSDVGSLMEKTTTIKYYGEDYSYYKTLKYYDRHYAEGNKDIVTGYKFENIKGTAYLYDKPDTELKDYLVNITIEMNNPKYNIEVYSTSEVKNADVGNLRLYKLTYNSNGGSTCPDNPKVALDRKPWGELCVPTKPQSGFEGWFIQKDGVYTKEVTAESIALEDIDVYAHWDNNKYSCAAGKYLPAGKTSCETCLENNYCPGITDVYYDKFHDQGISKCLTNYLSASGSKVKTDCKITCNEGSHLKKANDTSCTGCLTGYEKGRHEVSWGNISACSIVDPGKPSISGGSTKIYGSSDTTLTCSTPSTYESNTSIYYSFGYSSTETGTLGNWSNAVTSNTFVVSKTEYVGNRYYACRVYASGSGTSNTITSDGKTLLRIKNAKITFDSNPGTLNGTNPLYTRSGVNVFYDGELSSTTKSVPTVSKTGYTWNGWFTTATNGSKILNSSNTIESTTVDGYIKSSKWTTTVDRTLYAQYSAKTYTLTYNCNGGTKPSGKLGNATATYDEEFNISTDVCTKAGYIQNGWNTASNGSGTNWTIANTNDAHWKWNIDDNVTLYAVWKEKPLQIYYHVNGGTINSSTYSTNNSWITRNGSYFYQTVGSGNSDNPYNYSSFGLTKTGYTATEWCKTASGDTCFNQDTDYTYSQYKDAQKSEKDTYLEVDLYAKWEVLCDTYYTFSNGKCVANPKSYSCIRNASKIYTCTKPAIGKESTKSIDCSSSNYSSPLTACQNAGYTSQTNKCKRTAQYIGVCDCWQDDGDENDVVMCGSNSSCSSACKGYSHSSGKCTFDSYSYSGKITCSKTTYSCADVGGQLCETTNCCKYNQTSCGDWTSDSGTYTCGSDSACSGDNTHCCKSEQSSCSDSWSISDAKCPGSKGTYNSNSGKCEYTP